MATLLSALLAPAQIRAHVGDQQDAAAAPSTVPAYLQPDYEPQAAGSYQLPVVGAAENGQVLATDGSVHSLHELFAGRFVLLSFIYSRCSDSGGCPLATAVLYQTQRLLADDAALRGKLRLISLSFDPTHDTPTVMRHLSESLGVSRDWVFLTTASASMLAPILKAYQQPLIPVQDTTDKAPVAFSHLLRVFLIDPERRIRNIYSVDFLYPDLIRNDILTLLHDVQTRPVPATDPTMPEFDWRGAGDVKDGYESAGYVSRSRRLAPRTGEPAPPIGQIQLPPMGLPPIPVPVDNPVTPKKIALGRQLFFDRRLSLNGTLSCALCHVPQQGFSNNELATAVGLEGRMVRRNAPTLFNVAYQQHLFHDARETSLEQQVWQPLLANNEMANPSIGAVLERIRAISDYDGQFEAAFAGRGPDRDTVGMAIASYERTLISGNSPFDRWYYGLEAEALGAAARRGFHLFAGKAGCARCHSVGPDAALFSDQQLHNTGIGYRAASASPPARQRVQVAPGIFLEVPQQLIASVSAPRPDDFGRYEITRDPADRWKYRTPSLRNLSLTAPYMHDGTLTSLEAVVAYYNQGGIAHELLSPLIRPLDLSAEEMRDLVAFLHSLTGDNVGRLVADALTAPVGNGSTAIPGQHQPPRGSERTNQ